MQKSPFSSLGLPGLAERQSLVLIVPTNGGMVRLSLWGWLITHEDNKCLGPGVEPQTRSASEVLTEQLYAYADRLQL